MIIIHPLKIAYQLSPKVGSTSIKNWLYTLLSELGYTPSEKNINKEDWLKKRHKGIVGHQSLDKFKCPKDYFVFCVVRDPVERTLSAYNNRVTHYNKLNLSNPDTRNAINAGLKARPTLDYFIDNLEGYQSTVADIRWHTSPQSHFLGTDASIYNKVYKLDEMDKLRNELIQHWRNNNLAIINKTIPEIPRLQNKHGKKTHTLADLNYRSLKKCLDLYSVDYNNFPMLNKQKTEMLWQKAHSAVKSKPVATVNTPSIIVTIESTKAEAIAFAKIFEVKPQIKDGIIESLSGIILLKPSMTGKYKIIGHDAHSVRPLQWELPSPKIAEKYPKNPYAANARFNAKALQTNPHHPLRIFLEDDSGKRHLLFAITVNNPKRPVILPT